MVEHFFDRRLYVVSGKGGVGKSVTSLALALALARHGRRVLVVGLSPEDPFGPLLGKPAVGHGITDLAPGVAAINLDPYSVIEEYLTRKLHSGIVKIGRRIVGSEMFRYFYDAAPGLKELVLLGRLFAFLDERTWWRKAAVWDAVVLDAPATGHGIGFLGVAQVASHLMFGRMRERTLEMDDRLRDPEHSAVVLVTIPEEMAVSEAIQFTRSAREGGFAETVARVVVNRVYPERYERDEREALERMLSGQGEARALERRLESALALDGATPDAFEALLESARFDLTRQEMTRRSCAELERETGAPLVPLPLLHGSEFGPRQLFAIADRLGGVPASRAGARSAVSDGGGPPG